MSDSLGQSFRPPPPPRSRGTSVSAVPSQPLIALSPTTTAGPTILPPPPPPQRNGNSMNATSSVLMPRGVRTSRTRSGSATSPYAPMAPGATVIQGPVREQPSPLTTDRLVVGVDFGTTYSGVAAVYAQTPDDVEIIRAWPGANGITSDKVPTELVYEEGVEGAAATVARWGFQLKPGEQRLRCLKLFLDRTQRLPFYVSPLETAAQLSRVGKTVADAVADYLKQVHAHTRETLARRYGEAFLASTRVDWVLTCPAVWSDAAKDATLQAAKRAGMGASSGAGETAGTVQMISEPEAAAVYTLRALQPGPSQLRVGDHVVVCDAGGGTVDLIAYRLVALPPQQPRLRLEESAVGTGGLCGSAFLNYRFEEHVRERLGASRFDAMRTKKSKTWQMGLRYFEEFVKRNFHEDQHQEIHIPLPGLPDDEEAGLDSGFLVMTAAQVQAIFEPIVQEVCDLVQGQVDRLRAQGATVSAIVLVGGFGQSEYLYRRLQAHFAGDVGVDFQEQANLPGMVPLVHDDGQAQQQLPPPPYSERPTHATAAALDALEGALRGGGSSVGGGRHAGIEVIQPVYAWTAVVRGAVLRGLESGSGDAGSEAGSGSGLGVEESGGSGTVLSRRARFHYGTSYATVYDASRHAAGERYWSPLWERWMVSDRMQWHIAKGAALSAQTPVVFHYTRNFRHGQSLVVSDDLLASAADVPPDAKDSASASGGGVFHVCTLTTDLAAVPRSLFTRLTTTRGVEFDNLDFTLEMVVDSAGLSFELKVDGVRYGRVEANFQ